MTQQHYLFVSPSGDDRWSGTLAAPRAAADDGPFATLTRARDAAGALKTNGRLDAPVTVMLLDGTYHLAEPLELGAADSGEADKPITYCAYPGHRPVISGGRRLDDWQPYRDRILQARVPEAVGGRFKFRQLFFNGQRMIRARWPSFEPAEPYHGGWAFVEKTVPEDDEDAKTLQYEPPAVAPRPWATLHQAELFIFPWYNWVSELLPIAAADHTARTITLGGSFLMPGMALFPGNRFCVQNVLEELNQPGEWCLDTDAGVVYFWPPAARLDPGAATVPVPDRLIGIVGTGDRPAEHICIRGLTFTQTLCTFPEQLHPNFHSPTRRGEAIRIENARHCRIEDNRIEQVGGDGIRLQEATADIAVINNEISHTGALSGALGDAQNLVFDCDFGARVLAAADDRGWSTQLVLPLAALRLSPRSDTWKLNVVRIRVVRDKAGKTVRKFSSFAPLPELAYFNIEPWDSRCLGGAEIENLDLDRFLLDARTAGSAVVSRKGEEWTVRQNVRIGNLSKRRRRLEVSCSVESEGGRRTWKAVRDVGPAEEREETAEIPLPSREIGRFTLALTDTELSEPVFSRMCRPEREELSWKEHWVKQGDGRGSWLCREAKFQLMPRFRGAEVTAYGLAEMDNGEILFIGGSATKHEPLTSVTAFSKDGGATWSEYQPVDGCRARPMMLTYLGKGELTFTSEAVNPDAPSLQAMRFYSHDYGRTWPEQVPVQPAMAGKYFYEEGNFLVDRDASGVATNVAEIGYVGFENDLYMFGATIPAFRWSRDGGRTWDEAVFPPEWRWPDRFLGRTYVRGVSEGSVVRATNGWIVAALRTDCPARYLDVPGGDNLEGTAISISKDEGKTWSPMNVLFDAGRMHGNLLRLSNHDLVLTVIRRIDVRGGKFASYRRGCDAFVSHDNGLTWNLDRMYVLDDFAFMGTTWATPVSCGHLYSIERSNGLLLTTYSHYYSGRPALIGWKP